MNKQVISDIRNNSILYTIELIRDTSGMKAKQEILKTAIENRRGFKEVLLATYNPHIQYHIRKIPEHTKGRYFSFDLEKMMARPDQFLDLFSNRLKTGHAAENHLIHLLENLPVDDGSVLELILARDLKCGISTKSINKVSPGLIPEYPCMLAHAYKKGIVDEESFFPCYSQIKYDGLRANIIAKNTSKKNRIIEVRSRAGKDLGISELFVMSVPPLNQDFVYDGEIIVVDSDGTVLSRQKGNGIINKYAKGTIKENDRARYTIKFQAWDMIPLIDFILGESTIPYFTRLNTLEELKFEDNIEVVNTMSIDTWAEAKEEFERQYSAGEEGIMLKSKTGHWKNGRQKSIIKLKGENVCELYIKDVVEGKGRLKGKLGAFLCESECGLLEVSVGSGFSDDQREAYFDKDYIGKVISVKYNEVISQEKRVPKYSLFLPVFIELRHDKDTANTLEEIQS